LKDIFSKTKKSKKVHHQKISFDLFKKKKKSFDKYGVSHQHGAQSVGYEESLRDHLY